MEDVGGFLFFLLELEPEGEFGGQEKIQRDTKYLGGISGLENS
jgi:hypothetical protein